MFAFSSFLNRVWWPGFQADTRDAIPGWDGLLFLYGTFLVPILFALLLGINLMVWSRSSINYVFIFGMNISVIFVKLGLTYCSELDTSTRLDYRQYFEVQHSRVFPFPTFLSSFLNVRLRAFSSPACATPSGFHSLGLDHLSHGLWCGLGSCSALCLIPAICCSNRHDFGFSRKLANCCLLEYGTLRCVFADLYHHDQ